MFLPHFKEKVKKNHAFRETGLDKAEGVMYV